MGAVTSPLDEGASVRIFLKHDNVSLQAGAPGEIWAMTRTDSNGAIAIKPSMDGSVSITAAGFGNVVASGANSIAYAHNPAQAAAAPQPNETTPYTVIVPTGTKVGFYGRGASGMEQFLYGDQLQPIEVVTVT